jgi:hypothetical protein
MSRHYFTLPSNVFVIFFAVMLTLSAINVSIASSDISPEVKWRKTFGSYTGNQIFVVQTNDEGYLIAGQNASYGMRGYTDYKFSITKIDSSDQVQWITVIPSGGYAVSVVQTKDFGYAVGCRNGLLVKLDSQGNIQWNKKFSVISCYVIQTGDGGYIIAGSQSNDENGDNAVLVKADENGEILWTKTFSFDFITWVTTFIQTPDGGYALSGEKNWFAKTDVNGNLFWNQTYNLIAGKNIAVTQVANTADGGYILAGFVINGNSAFLLKTDSEGNIKWNRQYENASYASIIQDIDGGYVVAGVDQSSNYALIKLDSQGEILWTVSVDGNPSSVIATKDGSYVVTGTASSSGLADIFLAKYVPNPTAQSTAPQEYTPPTIWILIAVLVVVVLGIGILIYRGKQPLIDLSKK